MIFGATCSSFRAGAVPGAPGARRGSQGAEHRPKTRGRIYHFILPKVCPVIVGATGTVRRARSIWMGLRAYLGHHTAEDGRLPALRQGIGPVSGPAKRFLLGL